jgi:hypothetical protein
LQVVDDFYRIVLLRYGYPWFINVETHCCDLSWWTLLFTYVILHCELLE